MHITQLLLAFAASASFVSAISLASISQPIGDVTPGCSAIFNEDLAACPSLPGNCSPACVSQLNSIAANLTDSCRQAASPQGLLRDAMSGELVELLCQSPATTSSIQAVVAPTPKATKHISSGYTGATSTVAAALMMDTATAPTTMATAALGHTAASTASAAPSSTTSSGSNNGGSNGSLFSTQPSGSASVKQAGVWTGFVAAAAAVLVQL